VLLEGSVRDDPARRVSEAARAKAREDLVVVARREDDPAGRPDLGHAALEHGAKAVVDRFVNLVQDDKGSSARSCRVPVAGLTG
jgi:hypothetical protein